MKRVELVFRKNFFIEESELKKHKDTYRHCFLSPLICMRNLLDNIDIL